MSDAGPRSIRVLAVLPAMLASARIYVVKPLEALARAGRVELAVAFEGAVSREQLAWCDAVTFCRNVEPASGWVLEEAGARGKATFYDLDDDLWSVPLASEYGAYFAAPERREQLERYVRQVDLVRVFSPRLAERVRRLTPRVAVLTPAIDPSLAPASPVVRSDGRVRVVYAGGRGIGDPLVDLFLPALAGVLEAHAHVEAVFWREAPAALRDHPRVTVHEVTADYDAFVRHLASGAYDVGLAPLLASDFYLCKTDTKFRDYGIARIAGIYSDVAVYASVEDGRTGLVVGDRPEEWRAALERLVLDPGLRAAIAEAARAEVVRRYDPSILEGEWQRLLATLVGEKAIAHADALSAEVARLRGAVKDLESSAATAERRAAEAEGELRTAHAEVARLAGLLDARAQSWPAKVRDALRDWTARRESLGPAYRQLEDDAAIFLPDLDGAVLRPSRDLRSVPFLGYSIELGRDGLCEVTLALAAETAVGRGWIGIELVSPALAIVAQATLPLRDLDLARPVRFSFPPVAGVSQGRSELRVFARELEVPVRVLEWRRTRLAGLAAPRALPFCGLGFAAP